MPAGSARGAWLLPDESFYDAGCVDLAGLLIGCLLERVSGEGTRRGMIVETEAYSEDEASSHSFRGRTQRNWPMFDRGGLAYVYIIYGLHHCFNVSSGLTGRGEAVLVRALEPLEGLGLMREARGTASVRDLCRGPGRLCQAMGITLAQNGHDLRSGDLRVLVPARTGNLRIATSRRTGISRARELEWRFYLNGSPYVSSSRS
ncbi:DNA-3-methyladenine glycosylase [Candidatus Fermentibacterales bacterium]|nr:DNA-3-methyladenine glycosylase [Candidatus Fermentibacterales bacterium]